MRSAPTRACARARPGPAWIVLSVALLYCAAAFAFAGRSLSEPGLYYDEVIQAGPALGFLRGDGEPFRIPGARSTRMFGRWLPWMTQPYMGALKSQLLIPFFAVAEPDAALLRGVTLAWALLGIPLVMLFANRALGFRVALLGGALLAADPALLFLGRHDWGSFSLGFLLRAAALPLLYAGFVGTRGGSAVAAALSGVCLGLGLYNKIDFGVTLAAAAVALLIVAPGATLRRVAERPRVLLSLACGLALGALPLALAAGGALSVTEAATRAGPGAGELQEKLVVLRAVLDGSYFERLMLAGGRFDAIGRVPAASTGLGFLGFVVAVPTGLVLLLRQDLRGRDRATAWVVVAAVLSIGGVLATPRAVRAHHFLNAYPFPQLAIAVAASLLWDRGARGAHLLARGAALLLLGGVLLSDLRLDASTLRVVRETGGRGLWSHAVEDLAKSLPADARVVSLDWGFDGPVRFVAPGLDTEEPIWRLRRGGETRLTGSPDDVYLVYEPDLAVFPYGEAFLDAVAALPPDVGHTTIHTDRDGAPVFRSVRIAAPHELVYRRGGFRVELR